jgi:hypothetical protein
MTQTTTIQVQFGSESAYDSGAHLSAEIDDREGGLNNGNTQFNPGDTAWILVYTSANIEVTETASSAGTIGVGGVETVSKTTDVTFARETEGRINVPATGIESVVWLGENLGNLTLGADSITVTAEREGVAIGRVTYTAQAQAYSITSPASLSAGGLTITDFPILVLIVGDLIGATPE